MSDKIKDVGHAMRILTGDAEVELTEEQYHLFDAAQLLITGLERSVDIARDEATELCARVAELEQQVELADSKLEVLKVWWDIPGDDKNLSGAEKIIMAHGRITELEKIVEIITDEHNAQKICAEDLAKTHAENGLFRHQIKELEKQVESMRNNRDFMSDVLTSVVNEYTLFYSDEGPSDISDRHAKMVKKHWQPRGNDEGGAL